MLSGIPASPSPPPHRAIQAAVFPLSPLSTDERWLRKNWPPQDVQSHPPQGPAQGPPGSWGFLAGAGEG